MISRQPFLFVTLAYQKILVVAKNEKQSDDWLYKQKAPDGSGTVTHARDALSPTPYVQDGHASPVGIIILQNSDVDNN